MRQLKITKSITQRGSGSIDKYLSDLSREKMISPEEETELAKRIREGDKDALEKLVRANLRFVVSVAKQYQNYGLSLSDLISEGNIGLLKAAEKFDETKGFKFISYAVWWIRQSIMLAIAEHSRIIRLPLNQVGNVQKITKAQSDFVHINNREPTLDELAEQVEMPKQKIEDLLEVSAKQASLDAFIRDNEDTTILDILSDKNNPLPDNEIILEGMKKDVKRLIRQLPDKEKIVIEMYFGINTPQKTLEDISKILDMSKERARQLKERAIKRMKYKPRRKLLRKYLGDI